MADCGLSLLLPSIVLTMHKNICGPPKIPYDHPVIQIDDPLEGVLPTRLIRLADGVLVEVEARQQSFENMSAGSAPQVMDAAIDTAVNTLVKVCGALSKAVSEAAANVKVAKVEAEVGLAFEVEGNLYVTKSKGSASITLKITLGGAEKGGAENARTL